MLVEEKYSKEHLSDIFDKYIKKLRITPDWDIKLEFVEDKTWRKTGDFKIDCDDKKAILLLNIGNPKQENLEEVIVHELMHICFPVLLFYTYKKGLASKIQCKPFFQGVSVVLDCFDK